MLLEADYKKRTSKNWDFLDQISTVLLPVAAKYVFVDLTFSGAEVLEDVFSPLFLRLKETLYKKEEWIVSECIAYRKYLVQQALYTWKTHILLGYYNQSLMYKAVTLVFNVLSERTDP